MIAIIPKPQYAKILSNNVFNYTEKDVTREVDLSLAKKGEYTLKIDEKGIFVSAKDDIGFFYADKSIEQLLLQGALPHCEIKDLPKYEYRGFMLDCARHFFSVETVKKQIDMISKFKMNVFHWHLTDDQGWRIQIDKYPLLTEIGSYRAGTRGDNKPVSGYYTKDEIREIVAYAKERYIDVIPEIDMPGHFSSACASYPHLSCSGVRPNVKEGFGIHVDVACAGKESTYEFIKDIIDEVVELFPYEYVHLGGDEALRTDWLDCSDCQRTIQENGLKDEDELQAYFMNKIVSYLNSKGKKAINWNDGMIAENVRDDIVIQHWQEGKKSLEATVRELKKGRTAIISPFFSYYLDYPYGMTPLKKTFKCNPKIVDEDVNILGVECPLWTEYVDSEEKLEKQVYPRLLAVAERGWSEYHNNYKDFDARVKLVSNMFDKYGIKCARIKDANPTIFTGKLISLIKFFWNAKDKTLLESQIRINTNRRRLKEKYGK